MTDLRPCHLRLNLSLGFVVWCRMWILVVLQARIVLSIIWSYQIPIVSIYTQAISWLIVPVIVQRIVVSNVVAVQLVWVEIGI